MFIFEFIFQLVQALFLIRLVLVIVRMRITMLDVGLMVVTVVDLMSRLNTAPVVNAWEKLSPAHLHLDLFVPAQ